jgi:CheY-like chemotaxis protein
LAVKGAGIQKKLTETGSFLIFWLSESDSPGLPETVTGNNYNQRWQPTPRTFCRDGGTLVTRYLGYFLNFAIAASIESAMNLDSLLISRDADLLGVLRPALEKISVNIQVCAESQPGSDVMAKRKFDAVIIDCDDLPNGFDLLRALRQTQSNAKSVSFAVVNGKTTTQQAFESGANFVLQKPLTPLHASRCFNAALNFMVRERRRYFRHAVEMPLRISLPQNQEMTATSTNLSEGGMAIRILGKLPKDGQAQFRFTLPGVNVSLELKGQVAWADGTGHAGIRFVDVPQSSQYQLEKWLTDRLQSEMPARLQGYANLS